MGDSENAYQPNKKRAAVKELSRDNPGLDDEEDSPELETGFKRASDEVLASRRIVRIKRKEPSSTTPSSNPFAGICLVPPTGRNASSVEPKPASTEAVANSEKTVSEDVKSDATKGNDGGKDENTRGIDVKNYTKAETDRCENEKAVTEKVENAIEEETEKAKDDSDQLGKNVDDPVTDAAGDKEGSDVKEKTNTVDETSQTGFDGKKESEGDKPDAEETKDNGHDNGEKSTDGASLSSFQQHSSSKNAFTGLAGTGFTRSSFSFGSVSQDGSSMGSTGSLFGQKNEQPSFSFGLSNNGNSSLFGTSGASIVPKSEGSALPQMQEVPVETGEENERVAFSADSVLFEYLEGGWKERGKGELKVNVSATSNVKARLLVRARGNYRLILNASLYPEMKLTNMDKKGITFACMNSISEGKDGLSTFALKFKDASIVDEFVAAVMEHKDAVVMEHKDGGNTGTVVALKTPENSPKASAD